MIGNKGVSFLLLFLLLGSTPAYASTILYDWAFNQNGAISESRQSDPFPTGFDSSLFDQSTGIGTLSVRYSALSDETYSFIAFFDHDIEEEGNTYDNEYGSTTGALMAGQSWEIDEPGYMFGNIYNNLVTGQLDYTNSVPSGSDDDVSMALGWNMFLQSGETALIEYTVSDTAPLSGFYLTQTDPASQYSIYFSSTLAITTTPVPEPATILLLSGGLAGLAFYRRKRK